jgi:hypothetical protein
MRARATFLICPFSRFANSLLPCRLFSRVSGFFPTFPLGNARFRFLRAMRVVFYGVLGYPNRISSCSTFFPLSARGFFVIFLSYPDRLISFFLIFCAICPNPPARSRPAGASSGSSPTQGSRLRARAPALMGIRGAVVPIPGCRPAAGSTRWQN